MAKITLWGMNQWLQDNDNETILEELTLPEGIDKDKLLDTILLQCGEFESLYANPYFLQDAIKVWGNKHYTTLNKWVTALNIEYNPLENYDRQESWTEQSTESAESSKESSSTEQNNGTVTGSGTNSSTTNVTGSSSTTVEQDTSVTNNETQTDQVSAFDSNAFVDKAKKTIAGTSVTDSDTETIASNTSAETVSGTTSSSEENDSTSTLSSTESNTASNTGSNTRTGRTHGNIGVTTSQQMLQSELDIAAWNLYKHITDLFQDEFCVAVYY